jgi:tetratricopeptide (TPR) repeat protein
VYLVRDQLHDREVALKVLSSDYASALGSARFLREIRLASRLQHPYIVPVLDSGEWEGWLYYVMPVIEGHPLRARMARERQLPVEDAVRYTMEIADALQHAHERGVLHRDVKPENILISGQHACLADFGIARAITPATGDQITTTGVILGTPAYMSPEQASSDGAIDGRSDQYALGCVLFEMLAGVPPFVGPTEQSVIMQRFHHAAPRITQYRSAVATALEHTIDRALQSVPADRFPTVGDLGKSLKTVATSERVDRAVPTYAVGTDSRAGFRRARATALVVLASALAFAAWWRLAPENEALAAGSISGLIGDPGPEVRGPARELFDRAKQDFVALRIDSAEINFARAATADPTLALASLWQAQLLQWRTDGPSVSDWVVPARRAMRSRNRLTKRDSHHALALVALGETRFPDACREFGEVVRADSQSFAGWFGLGECRRMDRVVLPDSHSASGWRFRGELSSAIAAYTEALAWAPPEQSAPLFQRALATFYSAPTRIRTGRPLPPDSGAFIASPELVGDTIAFVPYRVEQAISPGSMGDARQRLREIELRFVRRWVQQMPRNVQALAALSLSLESRGDLADDDSRTQDALSTIREARLRNADPRVAILLQAAEVRLLTKSGKFASAGHLADSALGAEVMSDRAAGALAAMAVLQGREREAAVHLQALWSGEDGGSGQFSISVPPIIASRLVHLIAAVETGRCEALHLDSLERRIKELAASMEKPADRGGLSSTLLDDVRVRAAACTDGRSALRLQRSDNERAQLVSAAARKDARAVLAMLSRLDARRHGVSRSSLSWDAVAIESWALAFVGAREHAAARLDSSLFGLAYSSNRLTNELRFAGGLRRAFQLRSDLAAELGDSATSQRWRTALEQLSRRGY